MQCLSVRFGIFTTSPFAHRSLQEKLCLCCGKFLPILDIQNCKIGKEIKRMPQPKRRKLSLDEQDGKESEKNRIYSGSDEGIDKASSNAAGQGKESSGSQPDKRTTHSKSEKKAEAVSHSSSTVIPSTEEGKDGVVPSSSTGDGCGRVSSSGRVIKQTNKGRWFTAALEAAQNKQSTATGQAVGNTGHTTTPRSHVGKATTPIRRKRVRKRSWDLWSKFEQDAFFEGLFEHGKDFDAIHNLLMFRSRKRGIETALIKTKEQVRHLYYRMWQKISKHVDMGNNVKKETQEIYGLVNYYAIRKVFKRIDERAVEHLNELILRGVSKVREPNAAGKKNRKKLRVLRTPVCNALKKLNNIEDSKEDFVSDMPQQVTVELTPRSSAAWLRVHNLSHNPRVRFQVSMNRSLAGLLEYLKKKWKGPDDRMRINLGETEDGDEMMVYPHHSYTLKPVTLAPQRATSVDLITFSSYRDNVLSSPPTGNRSGKKNISEEPKQSGEVLSDGDGHGLTDNPKSVKSSVKINLLPKLSDTVVQLPQPPCEDENAMFPDAPLFSPPAKEEAGRSAADCSFSDAPCTANCTCDIEQKETDPSPDTSPHSKERSKDCREEERETDMRRLIESATKGFTRHNSKLVTLAQLSLMLGKVGHIRLEYDWQPKWPSVGGGAGTSTSIMGAVDRLTNVLRRLSSLANLEYRDLMQTAKINQGGKMSQCTLCGHSLEKANRKKTTSDVATETDPVLGEAQGGLTVTQPARLNSNGTLVGMSSKSNFLSSMQAPDTDGVFRVPMPIALPVSIRTGSPQKMTIQPAINQLIRPPENKTSAPNFMIPRKRKLPRKPVVGQRTLIPKMSGNLIIVPQSSMQPIPVAGIEPPSVQPVVSQSILQESQPVDQQAEVAMGDIIVSSSAVSSVSVQEIDAGTPIVSVASLLGENSVSSSDLFPCHLDMPIIVSPTSSPVKSTQQIVSSSESPPSLSSILDISLPATSSSSNDDYVSVSGYSGDQFLDMVVGGNSGFSGLLKSPLKVECSLAESGSLPILSTSHTLSTPQHVMNTPPHGMGSPFQRSPLKSGAETQWLDGDLWDFQGKELSLSEFEVSPVKTLTLGENSNSLDLHSNSLSLSRFLHSPVKKDSGDGGGVAMPSLSVPSTSTGALSTSFIPAPPSLFGESSQDSLVARLDMDNALQSMMNESSIDYSTKFEKLAEHLADNTDASQPNM